MLTAREMGRKGGSAKSDAKAKAAKANAKKPRGKWVTAMYYAVVGADGKLYVGGLTFRSKFDMDLQSNADQIYDYITEDLQWCKDEALPWKELHSLGGTALRVV